MIRIIFFFPPRIEIRGYVRKVLSGLLSKMSSAHGDNIRGRLGIPYTERGISIIIILVDVEQPTIGAITGAIGNLPGVTLRATMLL